MWKNTESSEKTLAVLFHQYLDGLFVSIQSAQLTFRALITRYVNGTCRKVDSVQTRLLIS